MLRKILLATCLLSAATPVLCAKERILLHRIGHMAASHAGIYKDSHLNDTWVDVRFLRPGVALAREATELTYNEGKDKRTSFAVLVLTKHAGQSLIAAFQNTLTGGTPVTPVGAPKLP